MSDLRILHLDDDLTILDRFSDILKNQKTISGKSPLVQSVDKVEVFFENVRAKRPPEVVLIDVHLEGHFQTGVEIARTARIELPDAVILMVSGTRDSKIIRECLRAGADDFVSKDVEASELATRIEASLDGKTLAKTLDPLPQEGISFSGATMNTLRQRVPAIINSAVNCVYIEGESGTGKEVVANLFAAALAKSIPFVRLNCGSIAPTLLASELFGHVRGAFTGAQTDKAGLIESADKGWIFLDEVATLPTDAQVALLRAIDNQSIRRVGATVERPVQFRVISATNEPLSDLVEAGKFRKDLWQRLRETHISLPPLRQRRSEIPELIEFFLSTMRGGPYQLAPTVKDTLISYDWPEGNVRELRNVLRAMTEKAVSGLLTPKSIPERIWDTLDAPPNASLKMSTGQSDSHNTNEVRISWNGERPSFDVLSQLMLLEVIRLEHRRQGALSLRGLGKSLGVAKSTIATRIKALVEDKIISQDELNTMLKTSSLKDED